MDQLDALLNNSKPHVAPSAALDAVTTTITRPQRKRGFVIAGLVTLSLAGGTAAVAGNGPLDDLIDFYLNGQPNDHAWEMYITGVDGTQHCVGGIVILPTDYREDYVEADYLAIKRFVQNYDWSDLEPNPALLHPGQRGTAYQLAITADRNMIVIAEAAGYTVSSISTQGTATCWPK